MVSGAAGRAAVRDADADGIYDESGPGETATEVVSVTPTGNTGNGACHGVDSDDDPPGISYDGRYVAFITRATDIVADANLDHVDVVLRDRQAHTSRLVSQEADGTQIFGDARFPQLTPDGRFCAFAGASSG